MPEAACCWLWFGTPGVCVCVGGNVSRVPRSLLLCKKWHISVVQNTRPVQTDPDNSGNKKMRRKLFFPLGFGTYIAF